MHNLNEEKEDVIVIGSDRFVPYITEEELQKRVKEMAAEITNDFKDKDPVFIGILNGSFIFMSDLVKYIDLVCEIDFLKLSSYGDEKISSGRVKLLKDLNCDIKGRNVIVVEDIVDTGLSVKFIEEHIAKHNPESLTIVSLLRKPESLKYNAKIHYIGFDIPGKFVIGYGLDYAQKYRNLRAIYALSE